MVTKNTIENKNFLFNILLGLVFAFPPSIKNIIHELIDILAKDGANTFLELVPLLKIGVLIVGYFLILTSITQAAISYFRWKY